jgi:predicted O-linked N-acetylglucosamine transferase (SPINDLY family)
MRLPHESACSLVLLVLLGFFFAGTSFAFAFTEEEIQTMLMEKWNRIQAMPQWSSVRREALEEFIVLQPNHLETKMLLGFERIHAGDTETGFLMVESLFDSNKTNPTIDQKDMFMAYRFSNYVGRHRFQTGEYKKARYFTALSLKLSKEVAPAGDPCATLQLATMFDTFPQSMEAADRAVEKMRASAKQFFAREEHGRRVPEQLILSLSGGAAPDAYEYCILSLFSLSFYYRADTAALAAEHYNLEVAAWPELAYIAPRVKQYEEIRLQGIRPPCVRRKIRLAVVSGVMTQNHPVSEDFAGVLERLDRNIFDVTYIYIQEKEGEFLGLFTMRHKVDTTKIFNFDESLDRGNSTYRIQRWAKEMEQMEFDMIYYLDLTMSSATRRLGMSRLAPVQINSHGHPVTSGIPAIQYFVSWAEAEVEDAQKHYTEELLLIPEGKMHQFYSPRTMQGNRSRLDGEYYGSYTRADYGLPENTTIYLNMQKPFKLHPEFDKLICGVLQNDITGHAVLHEPDQGRGIFKARLKKAGCDLNRIHFLSFQPHHKLLALYQLSTVILDSYPAGGCTTSREALELNKTIVTLPARLLGGRWTLGLYNSIGLDESTKDAVIASTAAEYITKAVALGTDAKLRTLVEESIARAVHNRGTGLFARVEAVEEWQRILLEVSPVEQCDGFHSEL